MRALILALLLSGCVTIAPSPLRVINDLQQGDARTIVVYGTSLSASSSWVPEIRKKFDRRYNGNATLINSAQSGSTVKWGREEVGRRVISLKPDCVLIEFGMNDGAVSPVQFHTDLSAIIDSVQWQLPACEIVLLTMNPWGNADDHRLETIYQTIGETAVERNLLLLDMEKPWQRIRERDLALFNTLIPDGIHPTPEGSNLVTIPQVSLFFDL